MNSAPLRCVTDGDRARSGRTVRGGRDPVAIGPARGTLPPPVTVQGGGGSATITFAATGAQTVTATDQSRSSMRGSATVEVTPKPKKGGGCDTGATAGWAALLPIAVPFVRRRRR